MFSPRWAEYICLDDVLQTRMDPRLLSLQKCRLANLQIATTRRTVRRTWLYELWNTINTVYFAAYVGSTFFDSYESYVGVSTRWLSTQGLLWVLYHFGIHFGISSAFIKQNDEHMQERASKTCEAADLGRIETLITGVGTPSCTSAWVFHSIVTLCVAAELSFFSIDFENGVKWSNSVRILLSIFRW